LPCEIKKNTFPSLDGRGTGEGEEFFVHPHPLPPSRGGKMEFLKLKEKSDDRSEYRNGRLLLNPLGGFLDLLHRLFCFFHQGIVID
jgi:hypothetical protein